LGAVLIVAAVTAAYWPSAEGGYVRFDDTDYIEENPLLTSPTGWREIWTNPRAYPPGVPFYPVTFSLHRLEYRVWGSHPTGYHVVNLGLHALNALLVWVVLRRLGVPAAWPAALLFALHPVQAQSVAWLAERKNLLSAAFGLLAAWSWLRFVRTGVWWAYAGAAILFALGLLSKPVVCTLPLVMLLWIWWRRPPAAVKHVLWVVPLLVLAALGAAFALWGEHSLLEGVTFASGLSLPERMQIAGRAVWFYLGKLLLPTQLVPIYPHWPVDARDGLAYLPPLGVLAVVVVGFLLRRRIGRAPLVAVLCFLVTLAPTSGLLDFGYLGKSFVGDHYLYLPSIAVCAGMAAVTAKAAEGKGRSVRLAASLALAVVAIGLGLLTWRQSGVYRDAETFWSYVVERNPSATALSALGDVYLKKRDLPKAEALLRRAAAEGDHANTRFRLGCVLIEQGDYAGALAEFEEAYRLNRTRFRLRGLNGRCLFNMGVCLFSLGEDSRAAESFRQAAEVEPALREAAAAWRRMAEDRLRRRGRMTTTQPS